MFFLNDGNKIYIQYISKEFKIKEPHNIFIIIYISTWTITKY